MKWQLASENSQIEMRSVYGKTLDQMMSNDDQIVALDADLASSSGAGAIFKKYPNRSVDVGISEQNMIGVAAGLSLSGMKPYVHTFAPFCTRRVFDQLYTSIGLSRNSIHIYGSDPGFWSLYNGATHTTFEDLAIMRAIPNMNVFVPSDPITFAWILRYYSNHLGAYYTRSTRKPLPLIYDNNSEFTFGKGNIIRKGKDIVLIAVGEMVNEALQVAQELESKGVSACVVDLLFVKPYDQQLIESLIAEYKYIVTIENHYLTGGIGDILAAEIAESSYHPRLLKIGVANRFGEVGDEEYLKKTYGLRSIDILHKIDQELLNG